jgi:hypothetical protein
MLSAAAAALLAVATGAQADVEITTNTSTALTTATSGNISIGANGGVGITAASPTITINSNNSVTNNGFIANTGTANATGVLIDTSANGGVLFPPVTGFSSTGTIDLAGNGTGKRGIVVTGGGTYYGPISLTGLTGLGTGLTTQSSSMLIQGDTSVAFWLQQNSKVTSNILLGGGGIIQNGSTNSTQSDSIVVLLDGALNGNFFNAGQISAAGAGLIGIQVNGGINSCASAVGSAPAGFTCPTVSGGSFVNSGVISLTGTGTPNQRGNNPESGSAVIIASSIAGGFVNAGPGTGSNVPVALIAANGIVSSGVVQPTVLIDPSRSVNALTTTPRGPAILGPVTTDIDGANAGYSFINRGAIQAQPLDAQLSSAALIIQGNSSTYYTCLSASVGACTGVNAGNPALNTGGLLSTGDISATSLTNVTSRASGTVSAAAIYVGPFATIPRLDIQQQTVGGSTQTQGTVKALVSGIGQGTANALTIGQNATVPAINIGRGASVIAQVETNTITPAADVATASSPFALISQAIVDQSGSLKLLNNAGSITAVNTVLTPSAGTVVLSIQRAVDLSASTAGGTTINNAGVILGDVLFSAAGNNNVLNVGNTGAADTANGTGVINTPSNYAILGESLISRPNTGAPSANHAVVDFGSGTGHKLHVGAFGRRRAGCHRFQQRHPVHRQHHHRAAGEQLRRQHQRHAGPFHIAVQPEQPDPGGAGQQRQSERRQPGVAVRHLHLVGLHRSLGRQPLGADRDVDPRRYPHRHHAGRPECAAGPEHALPVRDPGGKRHRAAVDRHIGRRADPVAQSASALGQPVQRQRHARPEPGCRHAQPLPLHCRGAGHRQ